MKVNLKENPIITPLSSIFGSGFLIIVPILAAAVGKYAVFAMAIICSIAFLIGYVIRFNIQNVEPLVEQNKAANNTKSLEYISDILLVPAYVISVTLYLKIFASFALEPFGMDSAINENILVTIILICILLIALFKGLKSLGFLEKISLVVTFIIIGILFIGFLTYDISAIHNGIVWPTPSDISPLRRLEVVAGTLIVVQGFETTRYLSYKYDSETRIKACRNSQIVSTIIYLLFILLATPITSTLNLQGAISNNDLLILAKEVTPLLVLPLIIAAMLSQFSAAIADTFGASGNLEEASEKKISIKKGTTIIILSAIVLTWLLESSSVVSLASKAFAIYYFLQCLVALSVATKRRDKILFVGLMFVLSFIIFFAVPAG